MYINQENVDQAPTPEGQVGRNPELLRGVLNEIYDDESPLSQLVASMLPEGASYSELRDTATDKWALLESIADVLQPDRTRRRGDVVRWAVQEKMPTPNQEQEQRLFEIADILGMRMPVGSPLPSLEEYKNPVIIVESGANKTSVVRRGLAEDLLTATDRSDGDGGTFFQFGSTARTIGPTRERRSQDSQGNETVELVPNPEYKVVSGADVCGDLNGETVTEFEVNLRSAIQHGYQVVGKGEDATVLKKGTLTLVLVEAPTFVAGLGKLKDAGIVTGRDVVIATNGQYRPKDEVQANAVIGDQAETITVIGDETGTRSAKIYQAEIATLLRCLATYTAMAERKAAD